MFQKIRKNEICECYSAVGGMSKGCGVCGIYPRWLRDRATPKNFIAVYGLLGTVQAMAFIYIVVTLTTLEKRFKIPSRTTGKNLLTLLTCHLISFTCIIRVIIIAFGIM